MLQKDGRKNTHIPKRARVRSAGLLFPSRLVDGGRSRPGHAERMMLECCFCHHTRTGLGQLCHADLERHWNTQAGQRLVVEWMKPRNLHKYL